MGDLTAAEPLAVASLGLRLRQAAASVNEVRSVSAPVSWRGRAGVAFAVRLARAVQVVPRIEEAYDDAGRVLLRYARALEDAQVLALRASALRVEADRLSALSSLSGPDPGDALRMDADRWSAEAKEVHDAAARRAVTELSAIASSAPRARSGAGQDRFWSDARSSVWGQVAGAAGLVMTAGEALGGNRAARDELVSVAKQSWRVWEPFVELYQQLEDDRGGLVLGGAVGLLGGKGLGKGLGTGPAKPDGFLAGIRTGELTVDDVSRAWDEAHAEVALRDRIRSLQGVPLPPVEELVSGTVDLAHHEAYPPSHTIERHVGKSVAVLQARLRLEKVKKTGERSTFTDLVRAEAAVADALARSADAVRAFAASSADELNVVVRLRMPGAGTVLRGDGSWGVPTYVHVVLRKQDDGSVRIHTAMLRETWDDALTGR